MVLNPATQVDASEEARAASIERFREIVGTEHVLTSDAALQEFRDPYQPPGWDDHAAAAVVMPESSEQVQAIVRVAAQHQVPLWAESQGRNNGYGGAAPRLKGSITVNLRRMNRVLEIDDELCFALVEPGVSFIQLYEELRAGDHPLMLSVPDIGWGSVVGNSLDNGVTYLPYGQDFMAPCGMEVVLADGSLVRTGMGALPQGRCWNLYRRGFGPTLDPLFMQSNFGIVTKMGIWMQPLPEVVMPLTITARRIDDLAALIDALRRLMLDGTIEGVPVLFNTVSAAAMSAQRNELYDGEPPIPEPVLERMARELGVGRWLMRSALWGSADMVDLRFEKLKAAFSSIPGVEIRWERCSGRDAHSLENPNDRVVTGVPNLDLKQLASWASGSGEDDTGGHHALSPVVPMNGEEMWRFHQTVRPLVEDAGLDFKSAIMAISARAAIYVSGFNYDFADEIAARRVRDTIRRITPTVSQLGYGIYRTHLDSMDLVAEQFSFNDHAQLRLVEKIKDALDPDGILSPGKQGIWPAALR